MVEHDRKCIEKGEEIAQLAAEATQNPVSPIKAPAQVSHPPALCTSCCYHILTLLLEILIHD